MGAKRERKVSALIGELDGILDDARAFEQRYAAQLGQVHPDQHRSALNLLHYLALRQRDVRELQGELSELGLSSLGRCEPHVLANVHAVHDALCRIGGRDCRKWKPPVSFKQGRKLIKKRTNGLLGRKRKGSSVRIMVTLPSEAANEYELIHGMLAAGMNCARINCAKDGPVEWERMVANIDRARRATGRACKVFMDLAGPKLRTGPMTPGPRIRKVDVIRDARGHPTGPAEIELVPEADGGGAPKGKATIPVPADLFARLGQGSRIGFRDGAGLEIELEVESVRDSRARALCPTTLHVETGLPLTLRSPAGEELATGSVGTLPSLEGDMYLYVGDTIVVHREPREGVPPRVDPDGRRHPAHVSCTLPEVLDDVRVGEPLLLDDGKIGGVIREVGDGTVTVDVTFAKPEGTRLRGDKGINLPGSRLTTTGLTAKDIEDLQFVAAHADGVNVSFVNEPDDVEDLLDEMELAGGHELGLILKIETRRGFRNLPGILLAAMEWPLVGAMIARGDLAVEGGWTHLAQIQEEILWVCAAGHVPVVWATQVLDRLAKKGQPTRSEISDVVMAERAECVMLNKGPYINQAIRTLDEVLRSMQAYQRKKATLMPALMLEDPDPDEVGRAIGTRPSRLPDA